MQSSVIGGFKNLCKFTVSTPIANIIDLMLNQNEILSYHNIESIKFAI